MSYDPERTRQLIEGTRRMGGNATLAEIERANQLDECDAELHCWKLATARLFKLAITEGLRAQSLETQLAEARQTIEDIALGATFAPK